VNIKLYRNTVAQVSSIVAAAVLENEPHLAQTPLLADAVVRTVLQQVGQHAVGVVVNKFATDAVEAARAKGFTKDEVREIEITTVFRPVAVASPRMRTRRGRRQTCRPVEEDVRQLSNYLDKFKSCVAHEAYTAKGWPIGSGQTESAHRTVSQERMKLPGAWWSPESTNPMMASRVFRENHWWAGYWAQDEKSA